MPTTEGSRVPKCRFPHDGTRFAISQLGRLEAEMVEVQFIHRANGESEYLLLRALPPATERDFSRSARHLISFDDAQVIAHEILQGCRSGMHGEYDWQVLD